MLCGPGEPRGGDCARGGEVRQVRGHRPAEHGRGADPGPAGAGRRRAQRLRVHRQVSTHLLSPTDMHIAGLRATKCDQRQPEPCLSCICMLYF